MGSKFFRTCFFYILAVSFLSCSPKQADESDFFEPISEPPVYEPPAEVEKRYDAQYRIRLADKRYFGAAVPFGYQELSCSEVGCRIATQMSLTEVLEFIEYYFPYQVIKKYRNNELIHITTTIRDEFLDGAILPVLDANRSRPLEGLEVDVRIAWNRSAVRYEWQYRDPSYTETSFEFDEAEFDASELEGGVLPDAMPR